MTGRLFSVALDNIKITDSLFGRYARLVSEKVIPYQWDILNDNVSGAKPTYCIENFRVAAGISKEKRRGVVFEDSDLYKWIEAASYAISNGSGDAFRDKIDYAAGLMEIAQEDDGYLNTYFSFAGEGKRFTNLLEGHELYCAGHLIEAAVAYHEATGEDRLLKIAVKYADLICRTFGTEKGQIHGYPGHQEIELALVKLYRVTGNSRYLETAEYFISQRGRKPNYFDEERKKRNGIPEFFPEFEGMDLEYLQAAIPPLEQKDATGHAVRAAYMCSAMADIARETGRKDISDACMRLWKSMTEKRMYVTGSIGTSGFLERFTVDYDLPNSTNYSETCASVGLMMFGQRMAGLTGEASYYDVVERALYNTVLAGISQTGDRYFYVNPLEVVPEFCTEHTYMNHVKAERQKWFSVACCPPNVARTLASLGQYIYAEDESSVYIQQFISSKAVLGMDINMESFIMKDGTVNIEVDNKNPGKILQVRIPYYSDDPAVYVNGRETDKAVKKGYLLFRPEKEKHCSIKIDFHIKPEWISANQNVRADVGKLALMYGPCVYCLEEKDNGSHLADIYVDQSSEPEQSEPDKQLFGELPLLKYQGFRLKNGIRKDKLYGTPEFKKEKTELTAVPYCLWGNRGGGEMLVWQKALI